MRVLCPRVISPSREKEPRDLAHARHMLHVTCSFGNYPNSVPSHSKGGKNDIRESKSPGTKTPLPVHLGTSGSGQSILGTEIKALATVWPLVHLQSSERPKLHVALLEKSGQSLDFRVWDMKLASYMNFRKSLDPQKAFPPLP